MVELSTSPIWLSSHSAPLATHWLIPLRIDSKPEDAMEPPMLPAWQTGLSASRPVQPAASMERASESAISAGRFRCGRRN